MVSNYSAPSEWGDSSTPVIASSDLEFPFPIIPPQVNGATPENRMPFLGQTVLVSNYSAPSEWGDNDSEAFDTLAKKLCFQLFRPK